MNLSNWFKRRLDRDENPVIVAFAGGMGTQIISAAIYFSLKSEGREVYSDMSYFDRPKQIATPGNPGQLTHWFWQLDAFGLPINSFVQYPPSRGSAAHILHDGDPEKLELGLSALSRPDIAKMFDVPSSITDILAEPFANGYLCMHIRRGDYLNVASHLVSDAEFIRLMPKFSGLLHSAAVLSDSSISEELRGSVNASFPHASFLDDIDPYDAHRIMRRASVLICSNSTFSLTAALLSPQTLAVIPKQWFGSDSRKLEEAIHGRCLFQIMDNRM